MTSPTDVAAFHREYVGTDRRAARCFAQREQVIDLITEKRAASGTEVDAEPTVTFHHLDDRTELPVEPGSIVTSTSVTRIVAVLSTRSDPGAFSL